MSASVFISYSSKDRQVAATVCDALEHRGFKCWISSRNIEPGQNFQEAIVRAIRSAKVMVLVFTNHANNSDEIKKEIALAGQNQLIVIPVRVEDVLPNDAFAYEFATRQWIDLFDDWEKSMERLALQISATMQAAAITEAAAAAGEAVPAPDPAPIKEPPPVEPPPKVTNVYVPPPSPPPKNRTLLYVGGGAAAVVVVLILLIGQIRLWTAPPEAWTTLSGNEVAQQPEPAPPVIRQPNATPRKPAVDDDTDDEDAVPPAPQGNSAPVVWSGYYVCGNGPTGATLTITNQNNGAVAARFNFYPVPQNPAVATGSFDLEGTFNPVEHSFVMHPVRWINHPYGYVWGGIGGHWDPATGMLSGRILLAGCGDFMMQPQR